MTGGILMNELDETKTAIPTKEWDAIFTAFTDKLLAIAIDRATFMLDECSVLPAYSPEWNTYQKHYQMLMDYEYEVREMRQDFLRNTVRVVYPVL